MISTRAAGDGWARAGAGAGALAIALFAIGGLVIGKEPDFDAPAAEVAAFFDERQERIQLGAAIQAAWAPLFIWFLATVSSLVPRDLPRARRAATVAFGCGLVFVALFLVDVGALAVGALRPEAMASSPELAAALRDFSWLAQGMAAPLACGLLAAFAVLVLRDEVVWPRPVGWLALAAALVYSLRIGVLFSTDGAFAADGTLGLWVPVGAIALWTALASARLAVGAAHRHRGTNV